MQETDEVGVEPLQPLTPRQAAFAAEYLVDFNGTQAAIRAGYSRNGADVTAHRLLGLPSVAAAIERGRAQRQSRLNITQDNVLSEVQLLAQARIDHYFVDDDGHVQLAPGAPDGAMAAIKSIKRRKTVKEDKDGNITITYDVTIELWDKPGQLKLMGRHVGLFADRVEVTGPNGGPVETVSRIERVIVDPAAIVPQSS